MPNSNPFSFNASSVIDASFNPIRSSTSNRSGGYKNPLGQTEYKDNLSFGNKSGSFSSGASTFGGNYKSPSTSFQSGVSTFGSSNASSVGYNSTIGQAEYRNNLGGSGLSTLSGNFKSSSTSFQLLHGKSFGTSSFASTRNDIYNPWGPSSVGHDRGSAWGNGIASRNTFQ
jgi:hypothetical protein